MGNAGATDLRTYEEGVEIFTEMLKDKEDADILYCNNVDGISESGKNLPAQDSITGKVL